MGITGNTAATTRHNKIRLWRTAGLFLAYAIVHAVFVHAGHYLALGAAQVKCFSPASGLLVFVLLLNSYRAWPAWLLAAVAGQILANPHDAVFNSQLALVSVLQAGLVAIIIRGFSGRPVDRTRPRTALAGFVLGAIIGPAIGALPAAAVIHQTSTAGAFWQLWQFWWLTHCMGILFITPVLLTWYLKPDRQPERPWESAAVLVALAVVTQLALLTQPADTPLLGIPGVVSVLLAAALFLWAGLRLGARIVSTASLIVLLLAVGDAKLGFGPLATADIDTRQTVLAMQMFLALMALSVLTLAVASNERLRSREAMARRVKFKEIISHLSTEIINADPGDIDTQIENALGEIGRFAAADRCHLIEFDNQQQTISRTHEWCSPGISGELEEHEKLPDSVPWATDKIRQRRQIIVFDINELPAAANSLRAQMTASGIKSLVYVPLVVEEAVLFTPGFAVDAVVGAVGFQWLRHAVHPGSDIAALLHIVGQLFINSLQRKRNLEDLQSQQRRLSSLASALSLAEERARRRTAVDLHDGIAQNLAVVRMKLGQLADPKPDSDHALIAELRRIIDDTGTATQHIIADLSPPILYELGLLPAIKWLAARFEKQEAASCTITGSEQIAELSEETRLVLFQAVRELLINIGKHAQAATVAIDLRSTQTDIKIRIQDDGVGFNIAELAQSDITHGGFGLFSIKQRLTNLGGTFTLHSSPGIGTTARISCAVLTPAAPSSQPLARPLETQ